MRAIITRTIERMRAQVTRLTQINTDDVVDNVPSVSAISSKPVFVQFPQLPFLSDCVKCIPAGMGYQLKPHYTFRHFQDFELVATCSVQHARTFC